jgi:hypothetical protein
MSIGSRKPSFRVFRKRPIRREDLLRGYLENKLM